MPEIRVRFAPSPTGYLHVGGARTALFNYLFAKHNRGKLILRIEDTDIERSEKHFEDEILESLNWLGIEWDEGPVFQSQRFDIYREYAKKLLDAGNAYEEKTDKGVAIRYKTDLNSIKFNDLIRGEIEFKEGFEDTVILKSDGSPTYNFACVIDDATLGITHIIRGEDHISNTPKQVLLYRVLGLKEPLFAHLPLILGSDRTRLSKRHGAVAVTAYKNDGFLPSALFNFLALLGWSPGDNREILSKKELINIFSLQRINKANAVFDVEKLKWMNKKYLRQIKDDVYKASLTPFIEKKGLLDKYKALPLDKEAMLFKLLKPRSATYQEYANQLGYILDRDYVISTELIEKYNFNNQDVKSRIKLTYDRLKGLSLFNHSQIEALIRSVADDLKIEPKEIIHPLRVVLTGSEISPPLFELIEILGYEETLTRIQSYMGGK